MSVGERGDGVSIGYALGTIARPRTEGELAGLLRDCSAGDRSVLPFGGGGSVCSGRVVDNFDVGLDTRELRGVIDYQPADLTLSVRAGTTMAEIATVLGERGQELPIDVPYPDRTTIGGLLATGFAGPRRLLHGTLKDAIIGCRYVRGDGLAAAAGGLVVKNVSGFEIPRLLHGSWGALAVLTSVNLKVGPRPRAEATIVTPWAGPREAIDALHALTSSMPSLAAAVVERRDGRVTTACRVMGRDAAVASAVREVTASLPGRHDALGTADSRAFWQNRADAWTPPADGTQVVVGVRPRDVAAAADAIMGIVDPALGGAAIVVAPSLGSIRVRFAGADTLPGMWPVTGMPGGTVAMLEAGSERLRRAADPWGAEQPGRELMSAIKRQFDPANVLNRGRLFV